MKRIGIISNIASSLDMKSYVNKTPLACFEILSSPMISYVMETLKEIKMDEIYIQKEKQDRIFLFGEKAIVDVEKLQEVLQDEVMVVILPSSLPLLDASYLSQLLDEAEKDHYNRMINEQVYVFFKSSISSSFFTFKEGENYFKHFLNCIRQDQKHLKEIFLKEDCFLPVKNRMDLATVTSKIQQRINSYWMLKGVSIVSPLTTYIGKDVEIGNDTILYPNTFIFGKTTIGINCEIGPNVTINESMIDNNAVMKNCVIEKKTILKKEE